MISNVFIIPTGNEIKNGIVRDTDSPMIMGVILTAFPDCGVNKLRPVFDNQRTISEEIVRCAKEGADLIITIGGSGEGSKYSEILGQDVTHSGMEEVLEKKCSTALYGKNGHMWSKLVCGCLEDALVINLPGPFEEAKAAIEAFVETYEAEEPDIEKINRAMAEAVRQKYLR